MKRKLLLLLVALLPMIASAYQAKIDGIYYDFSGDNATVTYQEYDDDYDTYISEYSGEVVIPESVAYNGKTYSVISIGGYAFYGCTSLTSITIPNSVTSIGERVFSYCTSLTAITIGTGIKDIGSKAFAYCEGLTDVYCFAENVPNTNTNAFSDSSIGSATLHVPASSISSYSTTEPWSEFGKIVSLVAEDAVTEVKALPILIQSNRGTITVQGANEGTEVSVFSVNGMKQGSAIATNGLATIYTSLHPGSTAIVKIGEKAIKVMVK